MPITIGAKRESDFTDPLGMLSDCHRRIERFLDVLITVATAGRGGPLAEEQRGPFETALGYFRNSAPKHTADEEESLFPRMHRLGDPATRELLVRVDALRQDHIRAEMSHQDVDRLGQAWLTHGSLTESEASRLVNLLGELRQLYSAHIAFEDREVFPAAGRMLSPEDCRAVGAEMAARRGLPLARGASEVR